LPAIAKGHLRPPRKYQWALNQIRHLARQIELLAPAVDDGGRRSDNCEYPWEDNQGRVQAPAERTFSNLSLLYGPAGRMALKVLVAVSSRLAQQDIGLVAIGQTVQCRHHIGKAAAEAAAGYFLDARAGEAKDLGIHQIGSLVIGHQPDSLAELRQADGSLGQQRRFAGAEKTTDEDQARKRHCDLS